MTLFSGFQPAEIFQGEHYSVRSRRKRDGKTDYALHPTRDPRAVIDTFSDGFTANAVARRADAEGNYAVELRRELRREGLL